MTACSQSRFWITNQINGLFVPDVFPSWTDDVASTGNKTFATKFPSLAKQLFEGETILTMNLTVMLRFIVTLL